MSYFTNSPPRIPPKQKEEQMENSSPNPSFSICDIRIQKQLSRSFGKSSSYRSCTPFTFWIQNVQGLAKVSHTFSPQKIALPKLRPHCSATCPNIFTGRTPKKNVLSTFKKNFTPAKSRKQGTFFFGVAERSEAVAERYERTIQFRATRRSGRAISHLFGKKFAQMLELVHKMKLRQK